MTSIMYNLVRFPDGQSSVTAFIGGQPYSVSGNHDSFERIVDKLRAGDASVVNDFDRANLANKAFHAVTDRVAVKSGVVYLDDKPVEADFNRLIVEYLTEGNDNAMPLVRFLERLDANPSFRSREQFVKQRTEAVNALRSHLYEFGHVAPEGIGYVPRLERVIEDPDTGIPDL